MLHKEELERIAVVLVRARNPNNIGAVARAMQDFGFSDLRLVNEFQMPLEGARSAVDAADLLQGATSFACLADAVADCTLVVGTTAVGDRNLQHSLYALHDAAPLLRSEVATEGRSSRVAILFGSEKTGLSNDELSHCTWLLTIPMNQPEGERHLSMNLGQAVAVCLYELVRGRTLKRSSEAPASAPAADKERIAGLLFEVLQASEYTRHHPAGSSLEDVRRRVRTLNIDRASAPAWMGILRQVLWKLRC